METEKAPGGANNLGRDYRWAILPLIVIAGAAVRFLGIGKESLWYDELYTVWATKLPLADMYREVPASGHPLLYYLVAHFWNQLGSGDVWYRMVSWTAGVATIWFVYLLGKELFSRRIGLWAAAFAAFSPFLIWYSRDATDYSLLISLATLSTYFLVRSVRRGGWGNWAAYAVVTLVALYAHFYAIALPPAEVALFIFISNGTRRQIRSLVLSLAAVVVLFVPWLAINSGASRWVGISLPSTLKIKALLISPLVFSKGYVGNNSSGATPIAPGRWLGLGFLAIILLLALMVLYSGPLRRALRGRAALGLTVCAAMLIVAPALIRAENTAGRDLALGATLFFILVAVAVCAAPRRLGLIAGLAVLVGLVGLSSLQFFLTHNDDWRGVIGSIQSQRHPGDEMLCFPLHDCVVANAVYMNDLPLQGGEIRVWDNYQIALQTVPGWEGYREGYGPAGNYLDYSGAELVAALQKRLAGAHGVWLVAGTRISGQLLGPDGIEEAMVSAGWREQGDYSSDTIDLLYYQRS